MLSNLNLSQKFNLLLILVFIGGVSLSGLAFSSILSRNAEREITTQANLLMETMTSVRDYTQMQINPLLEARLETEAAFLPQTVPAYSAREVFEDLRKNSDYRNFFYKEATLNPTNLRDKADGFETQLVENFRNNKNLQDQDFSGYRQFAGEKLFYIARPIPVSEQSCLRCHSTPAAAPKSQIATYGSENGFGWRLNDIIGAQVISVPSSEVVNRARRSFFLIMAIVTAAFAIAILVTNLLLKRAVIHPVKQIVNVANEVSTGNMSAEFEQASNDEIGMLSAAFNRMKISLALAIDLLNQRRGN